MSERVIVPRPFRLPWERETPREAAERTVAEFLRIMRARLAKGGER